jgi:hypothetical protein
LEFKLHVFYASQGTLHQTSCVETPQQNTIVERKHQHLLNITRGLLFQSNLPHCFWSYALGHSAFLINRIPSLVLHEKSPYEQLYNCLPDLSLLKVFGCLSFASTLTNHRKKLDSRARKCVFLGYKPGTKGYLLFDVHNREIFISRNLLFYEHTFPYPAHNNNNAEDSAPCLPSFQDHFAL